MRGDFYHNLDFISLEEIYCDYLSSLVEYDSHTFCTDKINTNQELKEEAEIIFNKVKDRLDTHYSYWFNSFRFDNMYNASGVSNHCHPFFSITHVNKDCKINAAYVDFVLAHEGTHSLTNDDSEWLEELIALDVAYELNENGYRDGIKKSIYTHRIHQTIDAMAVKLRDEGKSEVEIAQFLRDKCFANDDKIKRYVNIKVNEDTSFSPHYWNILWSKNKKHSRYKSQSYLREKYMHKTGERPFIRMGFKKIEINPTYVLKHTDDGINHYLKNTDMTKEQLFEIVREELDLDNV